MLRIEAILGNNDVMVISEALRKIEIGGLTVSKVRGRGRRPPTQIHAAKEVPYFNLNSVKICHSSNNSRE